MQHHTGRHRKETGLPDRLTSGWSQPWLRWPGSQVHLYLYKLGPSVMLTDLKEWGWNNCSLTSGHLPASTVVTESVCLQETAGGGLVNRWNLAESCYCWDPTFPILLYDLSASWPSPQTSGFLAQACSCSSIKTFSHLSHSTSQLLITS